MPGRHVIPAAASGTRAGQAPVRIAVERLLEPACTAGQTSFIRGTLTGSTTSGKRGEGLGGFVWIANQANWGYIGYISELVTSRYDARTGFIVRNDYARISPAVTLDWRPS